MKTFKQFLKEAEQPTYVQVRIDGKYHYIQISKVKGDTISGWEVDKTGTKLGRETKDHIQEFFFIFSKKNIVKYMKVNLKYDELEPVSEETGNDGFDWPLKTEQQLMRMKQMELAQFADKELGLSERECWQYRGGPLPKTLLVAHILGFYKKKGLLKEAKTEGLEFYIISTRNDDNSMVVSINGVKYEYWFATNVWELYKKTKFMMTKSEGKALAWLKNQRIKEKRLDA